MGASHSVPGLDHRAVLDHRFLLRRRVTVEPHPARIGYPGEAAPYYPTPLRHRIPALPATLYLRPAASGRILRRTFRCPDEFRQAVQPGALAARGFDRGAVGCVRPALRRMVP